VNVLPYRTQPQCFWREALRQVMHSLNMGMVRDSAVGNFVERLQRPSAVVAPGWLELRKGVHTFLTAAGDLVVLGDGVLRRGAGTVLSSTTLNQRRQQAVSQALKRQDREAALLAAQDLLAKHSAALDAAARDVVWLCLDPATGTLSPVGDGGAEALSALGRVEYPASAGPSHCEGNVLQLGPWRVTCEVTDTAHASDADSVLRTAECILPGRFSYSMPIPHAVALGDDGGDGVLSLRVLFQQQSLRSLSDEVELQREVVAQLLRGHDGANDGGGGAEFCCPAASTALVSEEVLSPSALNSLDTRVRNGVPLIGVVASKVGVVEGSQRGDAHVAADSRFARFTYIFSPV
jgi:hypothetical protein